jgi:DNA-directed RNA polymerase subunit M/transcription elongation factor TFIIS
MATPASSSSSTIRRRVHPEIPLITCPDCGRYTVSERVVKTDENGNKGRVFYRCPGGKVVIGVAFLAI